MAQIILGMASSHAPQLEMPPHNWRTYAEAVRRQPTHWYQGKTYSLNWDAEGRATFDNDCVPAKAPKPPQVHGEPPVVRPANFTG